MTPLCAPPTGHIEISAQNHNFAVDPATLPKGVEVSHINLNDGTCAGMWGHEGFKFVLFSSPREGTAA